MKTKDYTGKNYPFNWLYTLSRLGVNQEKEDDVVRRIVFSNVVYITLPIVYFFFMVIDYQSFLQPIENLRFDQFVVPIIILICGFNLWLNKLQFTTLSKLIFITVWPFLLQLIPIKLLQSPPDYFIALPMGMIFHSMLIQLMFSHKREPVLYWGSLLFNFATLIFATNILLYYNHPSQLNLSELLTNEYYRLDGILYWLLFNLTTFYIIQIIESYIVKMNHSKELIEEQKEDLNLLNQNLEKLVEERTSELMLQNEKLKNYAHYNSHVLKAPFCRIQGLLYLQSLTDKTESDNEEIELRLRESVKELDETIREIQQIVRANVP